MRRALLNPTEVHCSKQVLAHEKATDEDFLTHAAQCSRYPNSAVLLSGGPLQSRSENRFSLAAWDPFLVLRTKGRSCTLFSSLGEMHHRGDPLEVVDEIHDSLLPTFPLLQEPFSGGAIGYFAYDLKNMIEKLPQSAVDDLQLPDIFLIWPRKLIVHDRSAGKLTLLIFNYQGDSGINRFSQKNKDKHHQTMYIGDLKSNFTHGDYLVAVRRVREYIRQGDVYQVNLSQRFRFPFRGNAFELWRSLFQLNPAPFYAYINAADHQILSTSMERFLLRKGEIIETRPIKGTRKRGATEQEDRELIEELLKDNKDDAELSMIVDLLRNDLGRICLPRSIRVAEHKRLETYQNVHHLVSIVIGKLREEVTNGGILRATFPGGSITGCPKIRAMEIIDELEPNVRHVYTGSIGYLGWHRNFDLNVAIRTAIVHNQYCYFSVGGGIVYDSKEEDEYQETLHKGRTLFEVIGSIGKGN